MQGGDRPGFCHRVFSPSILGCQLPRHLHPGPRDDGMDHPYKALRTINQPPTRSPGAAGEPGLFSKPLIKPESAKGLGCGHDNGWHPSLRRDSLQGGTQRREDPGTWGHDSMEPAPEPAVPGQYTETGPQGARRGGQLSHKGDATGSGAARQALPSLLCRGICRGRSVPAWPGPKLWAWQPGPHELAHWPSCPSSGGLSA